MNKEDREKLLDVAGFLQGWLSFKKPVPPADVVKLHFDLVMEVLAKNNEVLDLVSDCKKLNIHECLNDLEKVIEVKTGVLDFIDKGSLRYQLKKAIDKMICCR
jgi:hypothetical protein